MLKHLDITRQRLQNFASDTNLRSKVYSQRAPVTLSVYSAPDRITFEEAMKGQYRPASVGEQFGPIWSTHWVKISLSIPEDWAGLEVHLLWDSSCEACVWKDGQPMQGLTGSGSGWAASAARPAFKLSHHAQGGEVMTLFVEVAVNSLFGINGEPSPTTLGLLRRAEIATFDREAWDLMWDFVIIADMATHMPANTPRGGQALQAANAMVNACNLEDHTTWPTARALAAKFLAAHNGDGQHNLSAVGHAHIDTAWLWPLAETQRKCVRTFSSAIRYMDDYPDYIFACSQAQQFEWIQTQHPGLWQKLSERVKENRFVPTGGTWVEPDCNIPSGESLVRQFVFGQRFFRNAFGTICNEFWNPDVFGYSGALPQIMRGAGISHFLTQKLSWNQMNKPTSNTFLWEGIDGSQVLTHFPPADTYNAEVTVKEALFNVSNFKDHDRARESYLLFGYGDGGGGPTIEMLERLKRMKDVDGLPRMQCRTPDDFFQRCESDIVDPLVWIGELYFELHRGTYTTQARNKLGNRRSEEILHDVEYLAAVGSVMFGQPYPQDEINRLWKLVLLNQFHDIIPGSSINDVYRDSDAHYAEILASATALRNSMIAPMITSDETGNLLALNTLSSARTEVVELPGNLTGAQVAANGRQLGIVNSPALGYSISTPVASIDSPVTIVEGATSITLENQFVTAVFNRAGRLISLFDKRAARQAIAANSLANNLVLFDDEPNNWEAWDVDVFHLEKKFDVGAAKSIKVTESGPVRASIEVEYNVGVKSVLKQVISLTATSARLDFSNEIDWHERHKFLKVEFPFDIRAQEATYEIQFGHLRRPTHFNTTWDVARFEVSAHHWADLAEPDFGIALLNDCKYGYSTQGNVMRLSLLRSAKNPDPVADMGHHSFRYALLPHAGDFRDAGVIEEGYRFNQPVITAVTSADAGSSRSFFGISSSSVVIDTVKKAEDTNDIIVRLYEAHGKRGTVRLTSALPIQAATICNLLEEQDAPIVWADGGVDIAIAPFKLVTLKLKLTR